MSEPLAKNGKAIRHICLSFPGVTETVQWGDDLVFKVGGKMFVCMNANLNGKFSFKVRDSRFLELTDQPGIIPAPYLARARWIQVDPETCEIGTDDLEKMLSTSYDLVFSKLTRKAQREIANA